MTSPGRPDGAGSIKNGVRWAAAIGRIHLRLGTLAGLLALALVATIVPDVIARNFFNTALYGMAETSVLILVLMVFLGLPGAQARKEHYRVVVLDALRPLPWRRALDVLRYAICALIAAFFAWFAAEGAWISTMRLESSYAVVPFPVWPARIIIALGFVLLAVQYLVDVLETASGRGRGDEHSAL